MPGIMAKIRPNAETPAEYGMKRFSSLLVKEYPVSVSLA